MQDRTEHDGPGDRKIILPESRKILDTNRDGKTLRVNYNDKDGDCIINLDKDKERFDIFLDNPVFVPFKRDCRKLLLSNPDSKDDDVKIVDQFGNYIMIHNTGKENSYLLRMFFPKTPYSQERLETFDITGEEIRTIVESSENKKL